MTFDDDGILTEAGLTVNGGWFYDLLCRRSVDCAILAAKFWGLLALGFDDNSKGGSFYSRCNSAARAAIMPPNPMKENRMKQERQIVVDHLGRRIVIPEGAYFSGELPPSALRLGCTICGKAAICGEGHRCKVTHDNGKTVS